MSKEQLVNYYRLCGIRMGLKAHIVDEIPDRKLNIVFTKKEISLFLRKQDGRYVAREIVVGGGSQRTAREPILVFM